MTQERGVQDRQPEQEQVLEQNAPQDTGAPAPEAAADDGVFNPDAQAAPASPSDTDEPAADAQTDATDSDTNLIALVRAREELEKAQDQVLRATAEVQNVKRRARLDVEKAHKFALDKFVSSLLPVVDGLENGLKCASGSDTADAAMREGMELTLKLLLEALKKHGVEAVDPVGQPLDPNRHQAVTMVPSPDKAPNTVIDTIQKGYLLNGRVVRPAMVVVAAAAPRSAQAPTPDKGASVGS